MRLLLKGFEVELFTGNYSGDHVGVSEAVVKDLKGFVVEPDSRNIEYITSPESDYSKLREALLIPRRALRKWLDNRSLTLLPGSTLSLGDSKNFERSDLSNKYHDFIEETYGTNIVTTSIHINLGIKDLSLLFPAIRLVRSEAALFLALTASSPFLDGLPTGVHSQRWRQFPLTPKKVPIFLNHNHYVSWVEDHLANGMMHNERHLWTSVRPNGSFRPYKVNRLELRICDLITDSDLLLAITAFLELRVLCLLKNPDKFDPLKISKLSMDELADLSDSNDMAAAENSLEAKLFNWLNGESIICKDWIYNLLGSIKPLAIEMNMLDYIQPIYSVLDNGNQAMKWLKEYSAGVPVKDSIGKSIVAMEKEEIKNNSDTFAV